jgi:drug/metabolite transporter (DMT)-like permease
MIPRSAPTWALLFGAALWGVVWYPYRLLAQVGLDGIWATILTYGLALALGVAIFPRHVRRLWPLPPLALLMGLAIGWSNLAYVLAILEGEVMRVLLLFYLAPLWTVPLAWILLRERLDAPGAAVMALAFAGAMVILWKPHIGLPWPSTRPEWLGVIAGFLFALGNVLIRRLDTMTDAGKSIVIWAGVTSAALLYLPASGMKLHNVYILVESNWQTIAGIGVALVFMSLALQYGLARMPANRAIVILLFELVVATVAAFYLAGETLRMQDAIGGALIVADSLASGRLPAKEKIEPGGQGGKTLNPNP